MRKTALAVALGAAIGATSTGLLPQFLPHDSDNIPAVEITSKDSVLVDEKGDTLRIMYAGKDNMQFRPNDLDGRGDGKLAIGDTLRVMYSLYKDCDDSTHVNFWKYAPDVSTYPEAGKILMYRGATDIIESNEVK
jgi:hypothetical protein